MRTFTLSKTIIGAALVGAGALLFGTVANAGAPMALVEDIKSANAKVQPMDYLFEGDVVTLAAGETITISYLGSCAIESISGGVATINIGTEKSDVTGKGRVKRKFVECGGNGISLSRRQSDRAAGVVVRGGEEKQEGQPDVTVYSLQPIIKLSSAANSVEIERLDGSEKMTLNPKSNRLDLAALKITLAAGGVYRAKAGKASVVFKVANTARATNRNLISRLVEL